LAPHLRGPGLVMVSGVRNENREMIQSFRMTLQNIVPYESK
jgi:hypothetical protein